MSLGKPRVSNWRNMNYYVGACRHCRESATVGGGKFLRFHRQQQHKVCACERCSFEVCIQLAAPAAGASRRDSRVPLLRVRAQPSGWPAVAAVVKLATSRAICIKSSGKVEFPVRSFGLLQRRHYLEVFHCAAQRSEQSEQSERSEQNSKLARNQ